MKWIKASERLPELDKDVCLSWQGEQYGSGRFYKHYSDIECDFARRGTYREPSFELIEWLDMSPPASAVDEAEALYPDTDKKFDERVLNAAKRSAHITCAGMYTDAIERLKDEVAERDILHDARKRANLLMTGEIERLKKLFEEFYDNEVGEPCRRKGIEAEIIKKHWQEFKAKHNL